MAPPTYEAPDWASVEADVSYVTPMNGEKLFRLAYDPADGSQSTNGKWETRTVPITNLRRTDGAFSLERNGFQVADLHTPLKDWDSEEKVCGTYYPDVEALIQQTTGASKVVIFDHTIRRRPTAAKQVQGLAAPLGAPTARQPVLTAHNDYTEASGPQRVRDLTGSEAEHLLKGRFAVIQVWKPLKGPVLDSPLAVCDASTVSPDDLEHMSLIYPNRKGDIYMVKYNPNHRWYYYAHMEADQAYVFKCYDSDKSGVRFTPHTAFVDPTTPPDAPPRESIEVRALVFWPQQTQE
eukprot:jgi/Chrzof1/7562/Cz02g28150.t1